MNASRAAGVILLGAAGLLLVLALRALRLLVELRRYAAENAALWDVALLSGALAFGGVLILAGTRLRPALRVNLALALASAMGALYVVEGLQALDDRVARRLTEKLTIIESLRRSGSPAYGGVEPVRFIWSRERSSPTSVLVKGRPTLPLAGISRRTTVDCKEVDEAPWLTFVTDEHGFHNPQGIWPAAPVELAAVGDSFTAGSCVPSDQNMLAHLRQRYPSALNLGMAGSGPLIMLAEVREYLPLARPRAVLWCHYGGNDLRDLRRERWHPILARYLEDGFRQGLPEEQAAVDAALDDYYDSWLSKSVARLARHSVSVSDLLTLRSTRSLLGLAFSDPDTFAPTEEEFRLFETILEKARASVDGWGGRLYFVYLPAWNGPPRKIGARAVAGLEAATGRRVRSIATQLGLRIVDVGPVFASHPELDSLFACPGCHYSAAGYQLAADTVLAALGQDPPEGLAWKMWQGSVSEVVPKSATGR